MTGLPQLFLLSGLDVYLEFLKVYLASKQNKQNKLKGQDNAEKKAKRRREKKWHSSSIFRHFFASLHMPLKTSHEESCCQFSCHVTACTKENFNQSPLQVFCFTVRGRGLASSMSQSYSSQTGHCIMAMGFNMLRRSYVVLPGDEVCSGTWSKGQDKRQKEDRAWQSMTEETKSRSPWTSDQRCNKWRYAWIL